MTSQLWLASAVPVADLEATAESAGLAVARISGAGTQYCVVTLGRPAP